MAGDSSVIRVEKSGAMRCLPIPSMTRRDWSSEAMNRVFGGRKGMTFEGFFIGITWAAWFGLSGGRVIGGSLRSC